jgi:hypothetical protein
MTSRVSRIWGVPPTTPQVIIGEGSATPGMGEGVIATVLYFFTPTISPLTVVAKLSELATERHSERTEGVCGSSKGDSWGVRSDDDDTTAALKLVLLRCMIFGGRMPGPTSRFP